LKSDLCVISAVLCALCGLFPLSDKFTAEDAENRRDYAEKILQIKTPLAVSRPISAIQKTAYCLV
jgi:hypothetical protein